jgi:hypothetical protein
MIAIAVDHDDPVSVAVQREPEIGADAPDRRPEQLRTGRAAIEVDIAAVR